MLRHHVVGQLLAQVAAQGAGFFTVGFARGGLGIVGHHVGDQTLIAGHVFAHDGDDLGDALEGGQYRFDLAQFDAVAAHLHLVVQASQVFQCAVVVPAAAVAGAVGTTSNDMCRLILFRMILDEIIRNETIFGEFRAVQVAQRHAFTGNDDLAGCAHRHFLAMGVHDVDAGVVDGAADADVRRLRRNLPAGGPDGGLGRAVHVPQRELQRGEVACQVQRQRFATHQGTEAFGRLPVCGQQQAPGARSGLHDGDVPLLQALGQAMAVAGVVAVGHVDSPTGDQRGDELQQCDVEGQRGDGQQPVAGADAGLALHGQQQVGGSAMRYGHALGLAGGAGGVDDVGGRFGAGQVQTLLDLAAGGQILDQLVGRDGQRALGRPVELLTDLDGLGIGQDEGQAGVFGHVGQAILREVRIKRHVGGTGTPDGPLGDHHGHATGQAQADATVGADTVFLQAQGQLVAGIQQGTVAELMAGIDQSRLSGLGDADAVEQGHRGAAQTLFMLRPVPAGQQCLLLGIQRGQVADGALRVLCDAGQQGGVALQPLLDAGIVEERGAVLALDAQAGVQRREVEEQFEVLEAAGYRMDGGVEAGQCGECRIQPLVEVEHHRHERQPGRVAPECQVAQQRAEGEALVVEGVEQFTLHAGQPVGGGGFGVDAATHRQQVDAVADDVGQLGRHLAGGGHAHHHVGAAGQARHQQLEATQQQREQADAQAAGCLLQALVIGGWDEVVDAVGCDLATGRARVVGGQIGDGHVLGVAAGPEMHIGAGFGALGKAGFVGGVVGVGGRGQRFASHGTRQVTQHDAEGVAVADQVMGSQQQHAMLVGQTQQVSTKERTLAQVEGGSDHLLTPVGQAPVAGGLVLHAQIHHVEDEGSGVGGLDQHLGAVVAEDGAQGLMGLVHGLAGALKTGDGSIVERAAQVQLDGFVVGQ